MSVFLPDNRVSWAEIDASGKRFALDSQAEDRFYIKSGLKQRHKVLAPSMNLYPQFVVFQLFFR